MSNSKRSSSNQVSMRISLACSRESGWLTDSDIWVTENQSTFRESLIYRDGDCLVSEAVYKACTPAHILPVSRPEVRAFGAGIAYLLLLTSHPRLASEIQYYTEVLGFDPGPFLYQGAYGILLRDDLHHSHDRGEWALYPRVSICILSISESLSADATSYRRFNSRTMMRSLYTSLSQLRPTWSNTMVKSFISKPASVGRETGGQTRGFSDFIISSARSSICEAILQEWILRRLK